MDIMNEMHTRSDKREQSYNIHDTIDFSPQEKRLLRELYRHSSVSRWSWYVVYLLPMIVFAGYGVMQQDVVAIAVAFGALFLFLVWTLSGGVQSTKFLREIFTKYEDYIADLEAEKSRSSEVAETARTDECQEL
jgi:hypothetical protein